MPTDKYKMTITAVGIARFIGNLTDIVVNRRRAQTIILSPLLSDDQLVHGLDFEVDTENVDGGAAPDVQGLSFRIENQSLIVDPTNIPPESHVYTRFRVRVGVKEQFPNNESLPFRYSNWVTCDVNFATADQYVVTVNNRVAIVLGNWTFSLLDQPQA